MLTSSKVGGDNNALSKLQPAQVRELREGFQILDRDSDGHVGREDVADMLAQLGEFKPIFMGFALMGVGMSGNPSDLTAFFPPSTPQTVTLPAYLNSLASLLASLSPSSELISAFSAFDEDDGGQIDLVELRDALLHTAPEPGVQPLNERDIDRVMNGFTGRRAFGKQTAGGMGKKGEVFKYQEFVASIQGGASMGGNKENSQDE
jgi:Ca2+-binding EF-hand superfamily protein